LPSAAELSVRTAAQRGPGHEWLSNQPVPGPEAAPNDIGSNNWALAGRLTAHGSALVASDMHLSLRVPTTWYHARLRLVRGPNAASSSGGDQAFLDLNGVTLPGAPLLVAGSNGQVAWAFTNTGGHWLDVRSLSCRRIGTNVLRTPAGDLPLASVAERIHVRGAEDFVLDVESAAPGVLFATDPGEQRCWFASWLAQLPSATNMNMLALEQARSAKEVLDLASELGIPHQNIVVGDRTGHIGWAIAGRIPVATGGNERFDGRAGWRTGAAVPQLYDPPLGRVWSANARATDDSRDLEAIGGADAAYGAHYALGARARQIRDALLAIATPATPPDMLRIQLDDRALFLARWRELILGLTAPAALRAAPERAELRRLIAAWDAHADANSVGYRLVRSCRDRIADAVWHMLLEAQAIDSDEPPPAQFEQPLWAIVTSKPLHLLAAQYSSWDQFLLTQIDASIAALRSSCGTLAHCRWGEAHPVHVRHDFSRVLPAIAPLIDMPLIELPGDHDMPRVQQGAFGASERFAVSPGHEAEGYLHIPGGASGHPLSPYYRAGFKEWAQGRPLPMLPGPARHGLLLQPLDRKVN
jgi:penicillin amidase